MVSLEFKVNIEDTAQSFCRAVQLHCDKLVLIRRSWSLYTHTGPQLTALVSTAMGQRSSAECQCNTHTSSDRSVS